jgi:hypothetical protein
LVSMEAAMRALCVVQNTLPCEEAIIRASPRKVNR